MFFGFSLVHTICIFFTAVPWNGQPKPCPERCLEPASISSLVLDKVRDTVPQAGQRPSRRVAVSEGNGNGRDKVFHIQAQDTQKGEIGAAEKRVG
jgi:hypothetical protein